MTAVCEFIDIYQGLKDRFLYKNDFESIHILMNLYQVEKKLHSISPKYLSSKSIARSLRRKIQYRRDREQVLDKINLMIREDVDRLEFNFYLEGYSYGFYDIDSVNSLERIILRDFSTDKIFGKKLLFHYESPTNEIRNFRKDFCHIIDEYEKCRNFIGSFVKKYTRELISPKIFRLNENLDQQLSFDMFCDRIVIEEEETFLTINELNDIVGIIESILKDNILKIYKEASWFGLNDRLLNRY